MLAEGLPPLRPPLSAVISEIGTLLGFNGLGLWVRVPLTAHLQMLTAGLLSSTDEWSGVPAYNLGEAPMVYSLPSERLSIQCPGHVCAAGNLNYITSCGKSQ